MKPRPIAIDLFAGCGGMSLGLEAAGFDIAASVELDPIHCSVHHYNFPYSVTFCKDITQLQVSELLTQLQAKGFSDEIDLVAGGPPCQGFSVMGKGQVDDPRNHLIFEYVRLIQGLRPKYFLFENVPGLLHAQRKYFLEELLQCFEDHGYNVVQPLQILDASLFGAPQRRKRLILMGYRQDLPQPQYPKIKFGNMQERKDDPSLAPLITTQQVLSDLEKIPAFIGHDDGIYYQSLSYRGFRRNYGPIPKQAFQLCHQRKRKYHVWGHLGSQHQERSIQRFQNTIPGKVEPISRFLKLSPTGLCNTLRAGTARDRGSYTAPRPIHYQYPRCITIREAARLHTFPDWFQFHRTIWHGFREIGNSVVPFLAKDLGEEIFKCLEVDSQEILSRKLEEIDDSLLSFNLSKATKFWNVSSKKFKVRNS